jgi:hypothetical protein
MSTTNNLLIALIASSQNNKYITANDAFEQLDDSVNSEASEAVGGLSTFDLPQDDYLNNGTFVFTGALTGNCTVTLPSNARRIICINSTTGGHDIILIVGSSTVTATLSDANAHLIYCDGVNSVWKAS